MQLSEAIKWTGPVIAPLVFTVTLLMSSGLAASPKSALEAKDGKIQDQLGYAVAAQGALVVAGAIGADLEGNAEDAGAAYDFFDAADPHAGQIKLVAPDAKAGDGFGGNVALWNTTALIGAIGSDREQGEDFGAVYAFSQQAESWQWEAKLSAQPGAPGDAFGWGMAFRGNLAIIGAPRDDENGKDAGAAYVFVRQNGKWSQTQKLLAADGLPGDLFGLSAAFSGDTVVIGADLHQKNGKASGTAYVFVNDQGQWRQQAKLLPDDGQPGDIFGVRVALEGNTAVISARRDDDPQVGENAGAVYVFQRNGNKWTQQQKLQAPDKQADDRFGRHVAIKDGQILIGAMLQDATAKDAGAAYVFEQSAGQWKFVRKLTDESLSEGSLLGWSVAISDEQFLVGATRADGRSAGTGKVLGFDRGIKKTTQ